MRFVVTLVRRFDFLTKIFDVFAKSDKLVVQLARSLGDLLGVLILLLETPEVLYRLQSSE
jgi:hypothetical protein